MIRQWLSLFLCLFSIQAHATISLVAAESCYGEVAKEIGGPYVSVHSILTSHNQDPHLFTLTANAAILVTHASIVVYNGAYYDPWMPSLLNTISHTNKKIIVISDLLPNPSTNNVHFWYHPDVMPLYAQHLTKILSALDPVNRAYFRSQLITFNRHYRLIFNKLNILKKRFAGTTVMITEPFFNEMAKWMQLDVRHDSVQMSLMNDIPLTATQIQSVQDDLIHHRIRLVIFNKQMMNPAVQNLLDVATQQQVPIVGINEMMPPQLTYVQWILQELNHIERALCVSESPNGEIAKRVGRSFAD